MSGIISALTGFTVRGSVSSTQKLKTLNNFKDYPFPETFTGVNYLINQSSSRDTISNSTVGVPGFSAAQFDTFGGNPGFRYDRTGGGRDLYPGLECNANKAFNETFTGLDIAIRINEDVPTVTNNVMDLSNVLEVNDSDGIDNFLIWGLVHRTNDLWGKSSFVNFYKNNTNESYRVYDPLSEFSSITSVSYLVGKG